MGSVFRYCDECDHPNDAPTDIEVLSDSYHCRKCLEPMYHTLNKDEIFKDLFARLERLEEAVPAKSDEESEPDTPISDEYVLVKASTVRFLLGEEGSFERPDHAGPFWWRTILRNSVERVVQKRWINCQDRLPTEDDADFEGKVWAENGHETFRLPYTAVVRAYNDNPTMESYWMRTGLTAPTPPDYKEKA